jgi:uncharacterized membrane protein YqiK
MISISKGEQQVAIITTKGQADARVLKANAEAEAVRIIATAVKVLHSIYMYNSHSIGI